MTQIMIILIILIIFLTYLIIENLKLTFKNSFYEQTFILNKEKFDKEYFKSIEKIMKITFWGILKK